MRQSVTIGIADEHRIVASAAATWARSAHRQVDVALDANTVVLTSMIHDVNFLDAVWATALANEVEHHRHGSRRAATMVRLFA